MHTSTQAAMAVMPSVFGDPVVTMLKMLIRQRKRVTSIAILPGTISGGIRKLTQDTTTKRPKNKHVVFWQPQYVNKHHWL